MKLFLSILSLFIIAQANAQNYLKTIDGFNPWLGQLDYDYDLQTKFEEFCRANDLLSFQLEMIDAQKGKFRNYIRTVYLNNDGLKDIYYYGPSGGEPSIVYFFIQTNSGFKKVFEAMQGIKKITWKGELLDQVYVADWGCCAAIQLSNTVYDVKYDDEGRPIFLKKFQSIEVNALEKPKNYFREPINFEVENDGYKLRLGPIIDDTTPRESYGITGNSFATLKKGTIGQALASKEDKTGRTWWYVTIDFDENVQDCILRIPDDFPTKVIGWLSSRYVTQIED